jgi:hypothetical protein
MAASASASAPDSSGAALPGAVVAPGAVVVVSGTAVPSSFSFPSSSPQLEKSKAMMMSQTGTREVRTREK